MAQSAKILMEISSDVIVQLKLSHGAILNCIDQIQPLLRSYPQAKLKLREFQNQILLHFERQNTILCNELIAFYASDRQIGKIIEFLIHDLKEVKIKTLLFFDDHPGDMADIRPKNFIRDFTDFSHIIFVRINMEREHLFPIIEKFLTARR